MTRALPSPKVREYAFLVLFAATAVTLIGMQMKEVGLILLTLNSLLLAVCDKSFRIHMLLLQFCLLVLGAIPIGTTTTLPNAAWMGVGLATVVIVPYIVTRYFYKSSKPVIIFPSLKDKGWTWKRTYYLLFAAVAAYLILPPMLRSTSSYQNWEVQTDIWNLAEAYLGLNFVGIWDELFFVCTVFALLLRFFPFWPANIAQAFLFTSFLYTLGFQGWSMFVIFLFALTQGYVFRKTKSLLYILAIHLTIDLVLHLVIVYLHYPYLAPFFIT